MSGSATATHPVRPGPLWRNRDFALLWSGGAVSLLGTQISSIAYPLLVLAASGSAVLAGTVGSVRLAAAMLVRLPAGAMVDRHDRRRIMLVSDAARLLILAGLAAAAAIGELALAQIVVSAFLEAALSVFFRPSATAVLRRVVPAGQLTAAIARNEARGFAAEIAGPPIGGILYGIGASVPFAADAVSYLYSLAATCLLHPQPAPHRTGRAGIIADIADGARWIYRHRLIRTVLLLAAGANLVLTALDLAVIVITRRHGATPATIGVMLATASAGGLLGALAAPRLTRLLTPGRVLVAIFWIITAVLPAMAVTRSPYALGGLLAAALFCAPAGNTILIGYQIAATPDHLQGRVDATAYTLAGLATPLAPLLAGTLLTITTPSTTLLALAAIMAACALAASTNRALRSLPDLSEPF